MGTKNNPGVYDCYASLHPDEPYFLIKGRDPSGGQTVRAWAHARARLINQGLKPESDRAMVEEALACADAMDKWRETYNSDGSLREALLTNHDPDSEYLGMMLDRNADGRIVLHAGPEQTVLAKAGDRVRYLVGQGYVYEQVSAERHMRKDDVLEVISVSVGRSSSKYRFKGIHGAYNTVMFERIEEETNS